MGATAGSVDAALATLRREARELWAPRTVPRVPWHPTALAFLREHVSANAPVVLVGAPVPRWAASADALDAAAGGARVDVSWTPSGRGDAVVDDHLFVAPHVRASTLSAFLAALRRGGADADGATYIPADEAGGAPVCGVPYYSAQNDCLRRQLPELARDDLPDMSWARAAFGSDLDAVNLWVGDGRAATTMHKDHYENCYLVAAGEKVFTLRPPVDLPQLQERRLRAATYAPAGPLGALAPVLDSPPRSVPWVTAPGAGDAALRVTLRPGEMLYLPSLWYHAVEQRGVTIALNWWYDMTYDARFVYYSFLRNLTVPQVEPMADSPPARAPDGLRDDVLQWAP